jgi:hypothetical protein
MKVQLLGFIVAALFFSPSAQAQKADAFEGLYEIVSRTDRPVASMSPEYFLLDADTLGNIWAKYAEGPLPADLEKYREEPSILAGFTNRPLIFLTLERTALVTPSYIALDGGQGERLELRKRPDGADLGVLEKNVVSIYSLNPAQPIPLKIAPNLIKFLPSGI